MNEALCVLFYSPGTSVRLTRFARPDCGWSLSAPSQFDGVNPTYSASMGEAGTLASAASPAANPDLIYAGGQNNGASSGVLKTIVRVLWP